MIVDGVEEPLIQDYTFSSTGEHTVEFILKSDSIGENTFRECSSLITCTIDSGVTSIGQSAFYYCYNLTSCTIDSGVTSIGDYAFKVCSSLYDVVVNAVIPPTLGYYVFEEADNRTIYVPSESVNAYKAASGWSDYEDYIQPIS
jgi:hypothetical protein